MRTNFTRKAILTGVAVLTLGSVSFAQTTPGAAVNVAKQATNTVKLIDNKGTIKYLQSNNGITQITNTTTDKTTTTWQLGGTLTEETYIDVDNKLFALNGLVFQTGAASTDATSGSDAGTGTGWTLLVRDEATGATQKMLATDLVQSGTEIHTVLLANNEANAVINVAGVPLIVSKVSVYRNGAKLLTSDSALTTDTVTVTYNATTMPIYEGDIIEVQWIK
jgi:hypothetical protein